METLFVESMLALQNAKYAAIYGDRVQSRRGDGNP